jgi:S-DNA-T family DNA segregation ATPase FtsK/SpoIIIE
MAKAKIETEGLSKEIAGIIIGAIAILIAVSLFSQGKDTNLIGATGSFVAWALTFSVGLAGYEVPFLVAILAIKLLLRRIYEFNFTVIFGIILFIISSCALLALLGYLEIEPTATNVLGAVIGQTLSAYIGWVGAFIVLATVLLISMIVITGISFVQTVASILFIMLGFTISLVKSLASTAKKKKSEKEKREKVKGTEIKEKPKRRVEPAIISPVTSKQEKEPAQLEIDITAGGPVEFLEAKGTYRLPPLSLLSDPPEETNALDKETLIENSKILEKKLNDFDCTGQVLEVRPGPVVTMYEFEPAPGVKVGKITNLANDLALAMKASTIRIVAPIPGKSVVGIEIPNKERVPICFKELLEYPMFLNSASHLSLALGKEISGIPYVGDLSKMPHLLIAGATGSGKSVFVNAMIMSILFKATPEDVRFLMIDPKMLELSAYEGIPHLLTPVITDARKATAVLKTIVTEMEKRYKLMAELGGKNIESYNQLVLEAEKKAKDNTAKTTKEGPDGEELEVIHKKLPYIVVVIDELADLMMTSGKDVEECIVRLSQMARAAGIHLMVATQRPSVDVITGLVKTNFPARISFKLPSKTDSRTILDAAGAETLLGDGDMLVMPPGTSSLLRVHGPYISDTEIKKVTEFLKKQGKPAYNIAMTEAKAKAERSRDEEDLGEEFLQRYDEAVAMAIDMEMISTSYIQRRFRIGYNTAARLIEKLEADGIVGPSQGSKPREVLKRSQ